MDKKLKQRLTSENAPAPVHLQPIIGKAKTEIQNQIEMQK